MDRIETYIGQSILEWAFSKPDQNKMVALGKLATLVLGTGTAVNGLACTPQSPASMFVNIGAGEIYQQESLEATVCGTLPADTAHQITKQGIALDAVVVPNLNTGVTAFNPPGTSGQSINYLIQATYADQDVSVDPTTGNSPIVLPFFNSANPTQPYQGPNNSGLSSNTFRKGAVSIQVKAGVAAATGSQVTPAPDSGFVGLWVITVPFGAGSLTNSNIAPYPGSPTLPSSLVKSIVTNNLAYGIDVGTTNVYQGVYPLPPMALTDNMACWLMAKTANTGAATFTPNPGVIPPAPVVGLAQSALQGGEYVVGGRALHLWRADISSWVLAYCSGGALQIAPATQLAHAMQLAQATGRLLNVRLITSTGIYTKTPGTNALLLLGVGAGGAGGGTQATSSTQSSAGGGGGAGAIALGYYTSNFNGVLVTCGAGGVPVAGAPGGSGAASSFGSLMTLPGGGGGGLGGLVSSTTAALTGGGAGTSGLATGTLIWSKRGDGGGNGMVFPSGAQTGPGASSPFGTGGYATGTPGAGIDGTGFGGAGGGALNGISSVARPGGAGAPNAFLALELS